MMDFINDAVPYAGLVICTYALLSHRVCTTKRISVFNFALFIAIYLLLALADFIGFEPVVWTVICRCLILIVTINIIIKNHAAYLRFFYGANILSSYVSQIQTKLKAFGLYAGEIDGIAGKMTVDAVAKALERGICTSKEHDDVAVINHSDPTVDENINKTLEPLPNCSGFSLSANSMDKLKGVNPELVKVVKRAIQISKQDFAVNEGLRTTERQRQLVKSGASQTMNSRHIGGFAVDLVPIVNGKVSWDWRYFYAIAEAVQAAANELGINVRWGGCWEVINNKSGTAKSWVDNYGAERQKLGKKAFTDGPHFELPD